MGTFGGIPVPAANESSGSGGSSKGGTFGGIPVESVPSAPSAQDKIAAGKAAKATTRRGSLTGREPGEDHRTRMRQLGDLAKGTMEGPAALGLAVAGVLGGGGAVMEAGSALASKALPLMSRARPALGLISGLGTTLAVDKVAKNLGAPPIVADVLSGMVGTAVGGRVGMSPEALTALKEGGWKGLVLKWAGGRTPREKIATLFQEQGKPVPATEEDWIRAEAEVKAFKKLAYDKVIQANKPPKPPDPFKPFRPDPNVVKNKYPGPQETKYSPPSRSVKPDVAPSKRVFEPEPIPEPPKPFRPNPNVLKGARYPGSAKTEYSPASRNISPKVRSSERVFKPAEEPEATEAAEAAPAPAPATATKPKKTTAEKMEAGKAGKTSSYSFTHPEGSIADIKKQIFVNADQLAKSRGADPKVFNKILREQFSAAHGHGISEATYDELLEFNEALNKTPKVQAKVQ